MNTTAIPLPSLQVNRLVMRDMLLGRVVELRRVWDGPHLKIRMEYRDEYGLGEASIPIEELVCKQHGHTGYFFAYMTDEQAVVWLAEHAPE